MYLLGKLVCWEDRVKCSGEFIKQDEMENAPPRRFRAVLVWYKREIVVCEPIFWGITLARYFTKLLNKQQRNCLGIFKMMALTNKINKNEKSKHKPKLSESF